MDAYKLVGFGTYRHTELTKQVESDESSHSKSKSVSCWGLLLPYSSSFCSCKFLRSQGRRVMKNQCFRQAPSFYKALNTRGCSTLAGLRDVSNSATPSSTLFLFCNYLLDGDVSVTPVHLFNPLHNPSFLHTSSLLPCSLPKLNLLNSVLRQAAETSHQCGNRVWA